MHDFISWDETITRTLAVYSASRFCIIDNQLTTDL